VLSYCASKAALNMFTVELAFELKDQGIAVNSVNPGFTATDLNAHRGAQTVEKGADEVVRVAFQEHGPSGKFLESDRELVWSSMLIVSALALHELVGFFRKIVPEFRMAIECEPLFHNPAMARLEALSNAIVDEFVDARFWELHDELGPRRHHCENLAVHF